MGLPESEFIDILRKESEASPAPLPKAAAKTKSHGLPEVLPILDMVAEHDVVLSSGHLHISEIWPLFDEAKRRGVKRLLCNHPSYIIDASNEDI